MKERGDKMSDKEEGSHFKAKQNYPSSRPESCGIIESQRIFMSESSWSESTGSEPPCTTGPYLVNDASGGMVEELTMTEIGNSNKMEGMQARQKQWQYLYNLGGGSRNARSYAGNVLSKDKEPVKLGDVENVGYMRAQNPHLYKQPKQDHVSLMGRDANTTSYTNVAPRGNQGKFASPFSKWFGKNNLKEKAVVLKQQEIQQEVHAHVSLVNQDNKNVGCVTRISSDATLNSNSGTNDISLNKVAFTCPNMSHDGISLREWIKPGCQKVNKVESLNIFRQIVKLVDLAHSQQVVLQDVRPSYFKLLPLNEIKYIGSLVQRDCLEGVMVQDTPNLEHQLSKKRYLEQDSNSNKNRKLNENIKFSRRNPQFRVGSGFWSDIVKDTDGNIREHDSGFHISEQNNQNQEHETWNNFGSPNTSDSGGQQLTYLNFQLEEKWYTSPDELNGRGSTSSNIYSLGVLLFELFCCFESWEVHAAAMSDLRHRILRPSFLSENPKEAGFCLWLLHPEPSSRPTTRDILQSELIFESQELSLEDKISPSLDEEDAESDLLLHFLMSLNEQKEKQASKLIEEIRFLDADVAEVERRHLVRTSKILSSTNKSSSNISKSGYIHKEYSGSDALSWLSSTNIKEARTMSYINQIESAYFSMRSQIQLPDIDSTTRSDKDVLKRVQIGNENMKHEATDRLGSFFDGLCKYARYSKFELCTTLRNTDILHSANVICSLSFDRDEDYFAAAGVSKKIKIFEFDALLNDSVDVHYPVIEMTSKAKLSCVTWNKYIKNYLASTDYDGVVQLWDANTGQGFSQFTGHGKRAWSVDFSQVDPTKLASGSDDCSVKLWSINEQKCLGTIRNVANVCCVQFSPDSTHMLAFGSADYKTYCFDLRNTRIPWCTLAGHGKAVSYLKFLDPETIVSASTDNALRLWDLNKTIFGGLSTDACSLTLSGHINEKNFVGLSVSDGYIACGSETNEVYAYYRSLPMPITSYKFGSIDPISGQETGDSNGQFVSSVCWRSKSNMVVAANSTGSIKLLRMV